MDEQDLECGLYADQDNSKLLIFRPKKNVAVTCLNDVICVHSIYFLGHEVCRRQTSFYFRHLKDLTLLLIL